LPAIIIPSDQKVAQVGEETIYFSDLMAEASYFPLALLSDKDLNTLKEKFLYKIIKDSIVLHEAEKSGVLSLDQLNKDVFNSPDKDYLKRTALVQDAKEKIFSKDIEAISGEKLNIFFYNVEPAEIGLEAGERLAKEKLEGLVLRIKSGEITFKKAGEILQNDTSLVQLDKVWSINVYSEFKNFTRDMKIDGDAMANETSWSLKEGEMSQILLLKSFIDGTSYDSHYSVIKISKRTEGSENFEDWFNKKIEIYAITQY